MASNSYWQLEKEYYTIVQEHDLVIRLIEHKNVTRVEGAGQGSRTVTESKPSKVHEFKVKRETLAKSSAYFKKLLADGSFKEADQDTVDLHEDSAKAMTIWFKLIHNTADDSTVQISIKDVWYVLLTAHKYGFDPRAEGPTAWFAKWYDDQTQTQERTCSFDYKGYQQLLFPCYTFDHAHGFLAATKYLVYHATGHIVESRPAGFEYEHLRLDQNIIQQLNAARGRLKTILHRNLYNPIDDLLKRASCRCKANVLYAYEQSLSNTGAWPLESNFPRNSVDGLLEMLDGFPGPNAVIPQTCSGYCSFGFATVVDEARRECRMYFDGLCLDCMNASKPKLGDADEDYWNHSKLNVPWDQGCRVRHQQPTWYFSFLGRRRKMVEWVGGRRNNQGHRGADAH